MGGFELPFRIWTFLQLVNPSDGNAEPYLNQYDSDKLPACNGNPCQNGGMCIQKTHPDDTQACFVIKYNFNTWFRFRSFFKS